MGDVLSVAHLLAVVLASWRLTELVTMDRITEPIRRRWPHYLWGCPRCVSVWAGIGVTIVFVVCPWANWPLALSWCYIAFSDTRHARRQWSRPMRVMAGGSDLWAGIIDSSRAVTWESAGVTGGIPVRTTICATIAPYTGTAATINNAIAACPSGQVVFLSAGTFNLSTGITFNGLSNVTLRGAGPDQTFLIFTGATGCAQTTHICIVGSSLINWSNLPANQVANWTAGYAQGTTQLTLDAIGNLAVGTVMTLDQLDDAADTGMLFVSGAALYTDGSGGPSGAPGRAQQQYVRVTAISGSGPYTVTVTPGIQMPNWRSSQSPRAWWWGTFAETASMNGVEDLSAQHDTDVTSGFLSGIEIYNAYNCWVKNVRSVKSQRNHVWLRTVAHAEVRDSYFYGTLAAASQSYGVEVNNPGDCLVINNIFQQCVAAVVAGNSSGCVIAYNFSIDQLFPSAPTVMLYAFSAQHDAGNGMNLYEGNSSNGINTDLGHGTGNLLTLFRNQLLGHDDAKVQQNNNPIDNEAYHRLHNIIGNVLGESGLHTKYEDSRVAPGTNGGLDVAIYVLGYSGFGDADQVNPPYDSLAVTTLMRWGNFDYATNTVRWESSEVPSGLAQYANAVPASHTLPPSFFLSSKPSWWGTTIPWPPIGPDVTGGQDVSGHAYQIPAKTCYLSVMGGPTDGTGAVLSFNANACYAATTSAPSPSLTIGSRLARVIRSGHGRRWR